MCFAWIAFLIKHCQTANFRRHGVKFRCEFKLSIVATVHYKPLLARSVDLLERFGEQMRVEIFAGYHFATGGKWGGDCDRSA